MLETLYCVLTLAGEGGTLRFTRTDLRMRFKSCRDMSDYMLAKHLTEMRSEGLIELRHNHYVIRPSNMMHLSFLLHDAMKACGAHEA